MKLSGTCGNYDRRSSPRRGCSIEARVLFEGDAGVIDCVVVNCSRDGALLQFRETPVMPNECEIVLEKSSTRLPAQVIWRGWDTVGVRVLGHSFLAELRMAEARQAPDIEPPGSDDTVH